MDPFQLIESFFRNIVFFAYNLVETTVTIVLHPLRGPGRLYRRHRRKGARQIGALTFATMLVFLAYLGLFGVFRFSALEPGAGLLPPTLTSRPRFDEDKWWPIILGTLTSVVAFDAMTRFMLWAKLRRRPERRQLIMALVEYSLFWPLAGWAAVVFLITRGIGPTSSDGQVAFLVLPLFGLIPAGVMMKPDLPLPVGAAAGQPAAPLRRKWMAYRVFSGTGVLVTIFIGAAMAGVSLFADSEIARLDQRQEQQRAEVVAVRCRLGADRRLAVQVGLQNPWSAPILAGADDISLALAAPEGDEPRRRLIARPRVVGDPDAAVLLRPDATEILKIVTEPVTAPLGPITYCSAKTVGAAPGHGAFDLLRGNAASIPLP